MDWLFRRRSQIPMVYPIRGRGRGGISTPVSGPPASPGSGQVILPIGRPGSGTNVPTVFGPEVEVTTYAHETVVYGEGELFDIPENPEVPVNVWISGQSSAVKQYKFQTYKGQRGIGSIWIQFTSGTKKYNYPNVPYRELIQLHNAPSQGKFVNHVLRPLYSVGKGRNWRMKAGRKWVTGKRRRKHTH